MSKNTFSERCVIHFSNTYKKTYLHFNKKWKVLTYCMLNIKEYQAIDRKPIIPQEGPIPFLVVYIKILKDAQRNKNRVVIYIQELVKVAYYD